jgi:hypothetical protein
LTALMLDSVFEQVREITTDPKEKADFLILLSSIDAAAAPADLFAALPGTIRLAQREDADVFLIQQGQLHALVTVDPEVPDQRVVAGVYRTGDRDGARVSDVRPDTAAVRHPSQPLFMISARSCNDR